jgi:hypothetical protein
VIFGEVTGDSLPDLYVTMDLEDSLADLFFRNDGLNYFHEEGVLRGVDDMDGGSHGACFADLDNDGDLDLFNGSTSVGPGLGPANNNVYRNDGSGFFTDYTDQLAAMDTTTQYTRAVLAMDMDNDGDLDLFSITGYLGSDDPPEEENEAYRQESPLVFSPVDAGDWRSAPAGQGGVATDFDGDGDVDILAANRTGPVNILRNDGTGQFSLVPPDAVLDTVLTAGEGITSGDIDGDGDPDLFFVTDGPPSEAHLYRNQGNGSFHHDTTWTDVQGYMVGLADLDNDGDLDLVFSGDTLCYLNDGTGRWSPGPHIPLTGCRDPRSIGFCDIDGDGDLDFAVADKKQRVRVIQNDLVSQCHWLKVRLTSPAGQAGAFGAVVRVRPSGEPGSCLMGVREAKSGSGYLGQDDPVLHFGLGEVTRVDVEVDFPGGYRVSRLGVPADRTLHVDARDALLQIRLVLEGAWDDSSKAMTTRLSEQGFLPLTSPYAADPGSVDALPEDITDWVLVEFEEEPGGSAVLSRSMWLDREGYIINTDEEPWFTPEIPPGDYTIRVHHRNHLNLVSSQPVTVGAAGFTLWDFTAGADRATPEAAVAEAAPGVWAAAGGNTDTTDQDIFASDLAAVQAAMETDEAGYLQADTDLDGVVDERDYQIARASMLAGRYSRKRERP